MKNLLRTAAIGLTLLSGAAMADSWPERGINLTVGYGAGGTTDSTARVLATLLEEELGTSVTVINKPGGGGSVAAGLGAAQKPDGYNVFTFTTGAAVLSPHRQDLPYDTLSDFTFISQYGAWNLGIVVPADAPYQTFQELVEFAKANPGEISYAIAGTGTPQHLTMERLASEEELDWKAVPFKGGAASVTALLGGHVDVMAGATEWLPQVQSGDFKLLAIITGARMAQFPDVPTLTDLGYDIEAPSILGIAGPKDLPEEAVQRLDAAIKKATESEELQAIIDKLAMQMTYRNSADFEQNVRENYEIQGEIIRAAGLGK
ncbi:Bug family tripartite tricarboxylate transporter substrate binding protein [Parasedimentitalea maritima]|uniref:Tripartite tricarboxylate transporter substrate binding protein n=1 Tax=Parasedimentitalea maritima TaxID=2578117 RepID=A0A6A4RD00_9RHOB|nr:tripartite tricarboxylate transporter substrate binding protein [Zongyanglinia marina]KAE9627966.1 tripartite tricarboxylate transporter substrate binding protein [Zongyanglinia marina]